MSRIYKLLLTIAAASLNGWALNIIIADPQFGLPGDKVFGDSLKYAIQNASLVGPSVGSGPFKLTVNTNYGVPLPGSPDVIPSFIEQVFELWMGDFLIQQNDNFFGIVLSAHDGYTAGDLYRADGFQNSTVFNRGVPVSLNPFGTWIGNGTVSAEENIGCNGVNCAKFKVEDVFSISPSFAFVDWNAPFIIRMASATCANGVLFEEAPEPSTSSLIIIALASMLTWRLRCKFVGTGRGSIDINRAAAAAPPERRADN